MERTDRQQFLFLSAIAEVLCGILWTDRLKRRKRKRRQSMAHTPNLSMWSDNGFIIWGRTFERRIILLFVWTSTPITQFVILYCLSLYFASALRDYARMRLIDFDRFLRDHATAYKILISLTTMMKVVIIICFCGVFFLFPYDWLIN